MPQYKDFLKSFEQKVPQFIRGEAHNIAEDLVSILQSGVKSDGVEIRGHFSIKAEQKDRRKSIKFRDLSTKT